MKLHLDFQENRDTVEIDTENSRADSMCCEGGKFIKSG